MESWRTSRHLPDGVGRRYSQEGTAHATQRSVGKPGVFRESGGSRVAAAWLRGSSGGTGGMARSNTVEENVGGTSGARPWGPLDAAARYLASVLREKGGH